MLSSRAGLSATAGLSCFIVGYGATGTGTNGYISAFAICFTCCLTTLLQIFHRMCRCRNFENRSTFGDLGHPVRFVRNFKRTWSRVGHGEAVWAANVQGGPN